MLRAVVGEEAFDVLGKEGDAEQVGDEDRDPDHTFNKVEKHRVLDVGADQRP